MSVIACSELSDQELAELGIDPEQFRHFPKFDGPSIDTAVLASGCSTYEETVQRAEHLVRTNRHFAPVWARWLAKGV